VPSFSGSFSGKASSQTIIYLSDMPNHKLHLSDITGPQRSKDDKWNNTKITYWSTVDLVSGSGTQRGCFLNEHQDGDTDSGSIGHILLSRSVIGVTRQRPRM
jgi:hypothetical protein